MSIFDSGYDNLKDHARRNGVSETPRVTGWSENHDVMSDYMRQEMLSTSEQMMIGDEVQGAVDLFSSLNPNKKENKLDLGNTKVKGFGGVSTQKQILEDNHQAILDLQIQYPDAGLKTIDDIMKDAQDKARLTRQKMQSVTEDTSLLGKVGMLTGGIEGFFHDPILVGSMLLGAKKITGPSKALNAWKAFKTEAAIGAGAEMLITPSVMSWKDELDSPYSLKEAAINILTVGGFAGVTRAGGSYVVDVFEARKAIKSLRASGENAKADVVESYADLQERGGANPDAHIQAYMKAQQAIQRGEAVNQADLDKVTGGNLGIEVLDPSGIKVDAETFQFKSRGDEFGVTDRLQGVKKWDSIKAGTSIVWERADGARFIADGHQRLALAKRLIGDDAQEIGLNAFIMREADGYTAEAVRDIAAFKNIAEGSGSALDAAKVIRSGKVLDEALPTNSALVRDAQGLSKLDDASFRLVIDEKIDAKYGAIVGELVSNADEQAAVIRSLMKAKPANANQAKIMVGDMKAAGFQKTETMDLFGGMEITETLFKERAKVIDSAMRQIKKDKSIFKTLAEQESRIAGAGNKLDRDANLLRLSDDEKTLATLTRLANTKGPVSDAINNAARRVKSGESIQRATGDILPELRRSGESELNARSGDDGAGDGQPALTVKQQIDELPEDIARPKVMPEEHESIGFKIAVDNDGKRSVRIVIDRSKIDPTCKDFCFPKLKKILDDEDARLVDTTEKYGLKKGGYKAGRVKKQQGWIDSFLNKGESSDNPVAYITGGGGASGKGTVLKWMEKQNMMSREGLVHVDPDEIKAIMPEYKAMSEAGDYRAAGLVHKESSYVSKELIRQATKQRKNVIIDKTLGNPKNAEKMINNLKAKGYEVHIIGVTVDPSEALVRALERFYGSGRMVMTGPLLKAHKGFNANFEKYAELVETARLYDNTGREPVRVAKKTHNSEIEIVSKEEYNNHTARGKLNEEANTHKELRESQGLPDRLGRPGSSDRQLDTGRVGEAPQRNEAGRGTQSSRQHLNDQLKDSNLDLDDPYLNELHATELKQVDDLLAKHGDMEIPTGAKLDVDGNEVLEFRSAKEVMKELDDEQKVIDDMFKCMGK